MGKHREAPWFKVAVTFKLRRPRVGSAVRGLPLPDRWKFAGIGGPIAQLRGGMSSNGLSTSQYWTFEYDGARPPIEDGELILARLHMLPESE